MIRQDIIDLIADWAKPEILSDMYANNYREWADNLLYALEIEYNVILNTDEEKQDE